MNTQEQRLTWLLEFTQLILEKLKEWEWLKVRTELKDFLEAEPGVKVNFETSPDEPSNDPAAVSAKEILDVQLRVFAALGMFSPSGAVFSRKLKSGTHTVRIPASEGVSLTTPTYLVFRKSDSLVHVSGRLQNLVDYCLSTFLKDRQLFSRIDSCPECHRLFLRVRKQIYCSKRCINRVTRRKWLKDPANQKKESRWAHRRYEKRVKKLKGENVKVRRRKREKKGQTK
jgi:hypothetical protein